MTTAGNEDSSFALVRRHAVVVVGAAYNTGTNRIVRTTIILHRPVLRFLRMKKIFCKTARRSSETAHGGLGSVLELYEQFLITDRTSTGLVPDGI
jgi:hypothetical protein